MAESRVRLRMPRTAQEHETIAEWLGVSSRAAALSSDVREAVTPEQVAALAGRGRLFALTDREDRTFGVGTWSAKGNPRNLEFAVVVGDPAQWRSGLGGEAAIRLVDLLFMTYDTNKVFLITGAFNPYTLPFALHRRDGSGWPRDRDGRIRVRAEDNRCPGDGVLAVLGGSCSYPLGGGLPGPSSRARFDAECDRVVAGLVGPKEAG